MYLNSLTQEEKCAFFSIAGSIVSCDGIVWEKEEAMLQQALEEMGLRDPLPMLPLDEALAMLEHAEPATKRKL